MLCQYFSKHDKGDGFHGKRMLELSHRTVFKAISNSLGSTENPYIYRSIRQAGNIASRIEFHKAPRERVFGTDGTERVRNINERKDEKFYT